MPTKTLDNEIADCTANNIFTSSDFKERPITMSITQSNSFGSNQLPNMNMDGPELTISLSASSESLGFDENCVDLNLKGSFGVEADDKNGNGSEGNCEVSVVSSGGGTSSRDGDSSSVTSGRTNESKQGNSASSKANQTNNKGHGHVPPPGAPPPLPPPHGYHSQPPYGGVPGSAPHYHPHYQRQFYPNSNGVPQYQGGPPPQQFDHRYPPNGPPGSYNGSNSHPPPFHPTMPYQQSGYHQPYPPHPSYAPHGYRHGPPPMSSNNNSNSSNPRHFIPNSNSSNMSVSSHGSSRKRTIDGMMEEDSSTTNFTKHRSSSNSSTCSATTAGNNTSAETVNQMICESPMKRERTKSPKTNNNNESRRDSSESGNSLSIGGLSMGNHDRGGISALKPKALKVVDIGQTPVSKNTKIDNKGHNEQSNFTFDGDNDARKGFSPEDHSLHKQLRDQSFTPIHSGTMKTEQSPSPTFNDQLEIPPQLSWDLAGDTPALGDLGEWPKSEERNTSPMSFGGNISPMLFNISPSTTKAEQGNNSSSKSKNDDMMRMGVLSPSIDEKDEDGKSTSPLPFADSSVNDNQQRRNHSPPNHQYQKHQPDRHYPERVQPPFHAMSPKTNMPLSSPQSFHPQKNTPQGPKIAGPPGYDRREDNFIRNRHSGNREGPPTPNYQSPQGMYPGHMNAQDRVRNLRGRVPGALPPPIHLPPHMPSHAHFLTSPIGSTPRGMMMTSPHHRIGNHGFPRSPHHLNQSKRKCVPLKPPIPCKFQGDMEKMKNATVPEFTSLVNFPAHMSQKQAAMIPDGMRCCVMCGHACPASVSNKNKKGAKKPAPVPDNNGRSMGNSYAIIPTQNKGLCTQCDVNVWVVTQNNLEIKWCKGCKNFRPWAAFGEKGLATKCVRCRERQREKYAAQKEEKDRKKAMNKAKKAMMTK